MDVYKTMLIHDLTGLEKLPVCLILTPDTFLTMGQLDIEFEY